MKEETNVDGKRSSGSKKAVKKKRSSTAPEVRSVCLTAASTLTRVRILA